MTDWRIIQGDCLEVLRGMEAESVNCVVTSPPYYGLRNYGVDGQIGLEPSLPDYIATMVEVFREVKRVLRKDGTLWLNLGDSYASSWPCNRRNQVGNGSLDSGKRADRPPRLAGLKEKDLIGVPWRVAFALQDDGWYLRSDIVWAKPNPMPESVQDRPTRAHEYVFLMTKSPKYWYDAEAIRTPSNGFSKMPDGWDTGAGAHGAYHRNGREKGRKTDRQRGHSQRHAGFNDRWDLMSVAEQCSMGANARTVWNIATRGYAGAHFATFPPELPRRCILAGCPAGGAVLDPFAGSGTTLAVALELGRNAVGIELNPEYCDLIRERIRGVTPGMVLV